MAKRRVDSKEIGLVAGLRLMNHFFHTDYLHYGYWRPGVKVELLNLREAQAAYSDFLFGFIPAGVKTILDVGCGSGRVALELVEHGYSVDCISPSEKLTDFATRLLGNKARVIRGRLEDVVLDSKYDLVLFSESFQYIPMPESLSRAKACLAAGGSVLISDFFRNDGVEGRSPIGGGHSLTDFRQQLRTHGLAIVREQNVTAAVAPTIDLVNGVTMEVVQPLYADLKALFRDRFPTLAKLVLWKYRKKVRKIETKHFQGQRSGANFSKYKTYLTLLVQPAA